jgi:thiamine biosynthesis lipoprotein
MAEPPSKHVHVEHVMGTAVTFDVRGERMPTGALAGAVRRLHDVDAEFSPFRPDSAVSRVDRGELPAGERSAELRWIMDRCDRLRRETGGFFDAGATGRFDPSALVKGWAIQRAADDLRMAGIHRFCVTAGGDVVTRGRPGPGRRWRVGIRHPHDPKAVAGVVEADGDVAVATSGAYERGDHIVDPASGRAPRGVLSVTVTGPDLAMADAYATAAFAMGSDGPEWTLSLHGYEAMTILENDVVMTTPGFPAAPA